MSGLPSVVARWGGQRAALVWLCAAAVVAPGLWSCIDRAAPVDHLPIRADGSVARVGVGLGNLRLRPAPTAAQVRASEFLFGTEPPPRLGLIRPVDVAAAGPDVLICDSGLQAVLRWRRADSELQFVPIEPAPRVPSALSVADDGRVLVADAAGAVRSFGSRGASAAAAAIDGPFRPGGAAFVGDELWVSNVAQHRIEVFDASGAWKRALGKSGDGPGEFGIPLGIAATAEGAAVVDMLNCRVQLFARDGRWLRDIGGPGATEGRFGRPRGIAIGPDGTVFVVDAATQRVHAFDARGRFIGGVGGAEDGGSPLVLPGGIAIVRDAPDAERAAPVGFGAKYFLLVAEQMLEPGIRVYAWRGELPRTPTQPVRLAGSPHWDARRCDACHQTDNGGRVQPIARAELDARCTSCHDGVRAAAEAHPVGWPAEGPRTKRPPETWPLVNDRIACITCHDIRAACDQPASTTDNRAFVRGFDALDPAASCRACHTGEVARFNPHRPTASGAVSESVSCGFCHRDTPKIAADGRRSGDAALHCAGSTVCLSCHEPHADPAPTGHLAKQVSGEMAARLVARETQRRGGPHVGATGLIPLDAGAITCQSCHNPHPAGLFAPGSAQESRSADSGTARVATRLEPAQLCLECHEK